MRSIGKILLQCAGIECPCTVTVEAEEKVCYDNSQFTHRITVRGKERNYYGREEKTSNDLYPERLEAEERGAESSPDLSEHDL